MPEYSLHFINNIYWIYHIYSKSVYRGAYSVDSAVSNFYEFRYTHNHQPAAPFFDAEIAREQQPSGFNCNNYPELYI